MKLATTIGITVPYAKDIPDAVRLSARSPFKYLDYSFDGVQRLRTLSVPDDSWRDEVAPTLAAMRECGISFIQSHAYSFNPASDAVPYETGMLVMKRSMEICAALGIPTMVVHAPMSNDYNINRPGDREKYIEMTKRFFLALLPDAERNNVVILTENSCRANMGEKVFLDRGAEMAEFVDGIGSEYLKAVWDTGHANLDGANQYDDIMALGDRLYGIHVHDNFTGKDNHLPPFFGSLDGDGLMQGLLDSGYNGYFTFEAGMLSFHRERKTHTEGKFTHGNGGLFHPGAPLALAQLNYLYETGKYMLEAYDCFEC